VTTTAEMRAAVLSEFATCTTAIMAAAVADYHPVRTAGQKIKKGAMPLQLSMAPNPDILQELGAQKERKFLIGFAAETEDLLGNARLKLAAKNLDMIVANDVTQPGSGFDADTNIAAILDRRGGERMLPLMTKDELAAEILNYMLAVKSTRCDGDT
jgi:phosphopantothenoylcysteine decarboxylase/phosphopantothenate--cysteine ligase